MFLGVIFFFFFVFFQVVVVAQPEQELTTMKEIASQTNQTLPKAVIIFNILSFWSLKFWLKISENFILYIKRLQMKLLSSDFRSRIQGIILLFYVGFNLLSTTWEFLTLLTKIFSRLIWAKVNKCARKLSSSQCLHTSYT